MPVQSDATVRSGQRMVKKRWATTNVNLLVSDVRIVMNVGYRSPWRAFYSGPMNHQGTRLFASASALLLATMLLAGCSTAGTSTSSDSPGPAVGAPVTAPDIAPGGDLGGGVTSEEDRNSDRGRQVISTGAMSITADDPIQAASDAVKIVEDAGGRVDSRSEQPMIGDAATAASPDDSIRYPGPALPAPSALLVVRIPAEKLTATLDDIKELGTVQSVAINANDVTAQSQDLDSRITALSASVDRLVGLLAGATTTKDLIDIETALSTRQAELESLESQKRSLADQVDLSTISITFGSVESAPIEKPSDFFSGITAGWQTLVAFIGGVLVALGFVLPWLIVIVIIGAAVLVVIRQRKRRRPAERRGDSVPPSDPTPPSSSSPTPPAVAPSASSAPGSATMES